MNDCIIVYQITQWLKSSYGSFFATVLYPDKLTLVALVVLIYK